MIRRFFIFASAIALAIGLCTAKATARDVAGPVMLAQFAVAVPATLAGLSTVHGDERFGTPRAYSVTDVRLILSHARGGIDHALRLANGLRPAREDVLFRAQILAVSGGRLWTHGSGWCSHWRRDRAFCEVDCEGGAFEIQRTGAPAGGGAYRLALVLDPARLTAAGMQPGVKFASCATSSRGATSRLRPARRGAIVTIPLRPDNAGD